MFKNEEDKLIDYKKAYDSVPISLKSLDEAIMTGYHRAKTEKKKNSSRKRWLMSLVTAAVLFIGLVTSIRVSPTFAEYIAVIPGMEKIVELIRHDKGMMAAVENDYYQEIGSSQEKNGLKMTIDGAIADENGLVLFYTIQSKEKLHDIYVDDYELRYLDSEAPKLATATYGYPHSSEKGETTFQGTLEYFYETALNSHKMEITLHVTGDKKESFTLPITLEKEILKKKVYELNKMVTIEGQKLTFLTATVYPLRVAIHVKEDPANTKKLLDYQDLRLVDQNGETWNIITNGFTASKISDNEQIIYLQSNYFSPPEELFLVINKLQAINKDEAFIEVDIDNEKIVKQPQGDIIRGLKVDGNKIEFMLKLDKDFPFFILGDIKDRSGNSISGTKYVESMNDNGLKPYGVEILNLKDINGNLTFELNYFPTWIYGDEKLRIDLD